MSVLSVVVVNAILAAVVVGALAYVCRIPYRLDRSIRPREFRAASDERRLPGYERSAA